MRPVVAAALRHPISRLGVALTTASALLFLGLMAVQLAGFLQNPYAGLLVFIVVPALFALGLVLIPIGVSAERRRPRTQPAGAEWPRLDLRDPAQRRTALALVALTLVNLLILSMASYGAVEVHGLTVVLRSGLSRPDAARIRGPPGGRARSGSLRRVPRRAGRSRIRRGQAVRHPQARLDDDGRLRPSDSDACPRSAQRD